MLKRKILNTFLFFVVLFSSVVLYQRYFVVNFTQSMPLGVYIKSYSAFYTKNDLVLVCLDDAIARWAVANHIIADGSGCQHSAPLLKKIAATGGDRVTVNGEGIIINGKLMAHTAPAARHIKRWIPVNSEILLKDGEYIVVANQNNLSFDSRYFGTVTTENVIAKASPLWLWD